MLGIEISTSKSGKLWPTEYWKTLIDALARDGAKHDPRAKYRDLARCLEPLIQEIMGRFGPRPGTPLAELDDRYLDLVHIHRVPAGHEGISLGPAEIPDVSSWTPIEVRYFGTIGDSKYEAQSRRNRDLIEQECGEFLAARSESRVLGLSFQLSEQRKVRDLDNLADGLMPLFNGIYASFQHICLVRETQRQYEREILRITLDRKALLASQVHRLD